MTSHRSVAASVRRMKETNPQAYCRHPGCLWREDIRGVTRKPCPKHTPKQKEPSDDRAA